MRIRRSVAAVLTVVGLLVGGVLSAAPANAAQPTPDRPVYGITYQVINSSYVGNHIDYGHVLARCYATGGTCTITSGHTSTTTIDVSLGWSRDGVAGGLGISSASGVTLTVGCTSPVLASGQAWTAYAVGRYYTYQIREMNSQPSGVTYTTSGWLHAFSAYNNQIACQ